MVAMATLAPLQLRPCINSSIIVKIWAFHEVKNISEFLVVLEKFKKKKKRKKITISEILFALKPFSYHQFMGLWTFVGLDCSVIMFLRISKYKEFLMEWRLYTINLKRKLILIYSLLDKNFLLLGALYLMECHAFTLIIYGLFQK